jgi:tetratricopeptide (TPR) repeat protein
LKRWRGIDEYFVTSLDRELNFSGLCIQAIDTKASVDKMAVNHDFSGMDVSLEAAHIPLWDKTIFGVLSHAASTGPDLNAVIAASPDFALAQAIRGISCLLLGRSEMVQVAREALTAAKVAAARRAPTAREMAFVLALEEWLNGRPTVAARRMQAVMEAYPRDALAMKMVQAIHFVMGRPQDMRASVESVLPAWDDHPARGYLLGCHAFTLEETGDYEGAERAGKQGIALAPQDAWGLHAVAHVYDMTARAAEGLAWLEGRESSWAHCNNFRFHVWWHRALMYLDLGQYDAALQLYDAEVRSEKTDDYRDIANAASLLSRLEIEGVGVGDRWSELADLAENRATDGCLAFADLHYLLSLIGGERNAAAARLVAGMAAARPTDSESKKIISHPGLQVAHGLQAFAAGEYAAAWLHLQHAQADLCQIGGSHAQRDVFARITIEAALRGGYADAAESMLRVRMKQRNGSADGYTQRRLELVMNARERAV